MQVTQRISPCLWFDHQAEEAARFYTGIFPNSRITEISRYGEAGHEIHGQAPGSVMAVDFDLDGVSFTAINGGPVFQFNEAVSLQINCENQQEVDYYWDRLTDGGDVRAQQCGWLKDKFGVSWQVIPIELSALVNDPDSENCRRATEAMLQMKKLDIGELKRAYAGELV